MQPLRCLRAAAARHGLTPPDARHTRLSDYENETGKVQCTVCGEKYETRCTPLTDAVDIYSEWLDACHEIN